MVNADDLQNVGLTRNEATVYLSLLEIGETKTGAIAKKTHLHRVLIYDALESLIQKGLASYCVKENRKYFQAAQPSTIIKFLEEKKESAQKFLPELEILRSNKTVQNIIVYESIKGIKAAILSMIEEMPNASSNVCFGTGNMIAELGEGFYHLFQKKKTEKKIQSRILFDKSFQKNAPIFSKGTIVRYVGLGPFATDTWIYNEKVLMIHYNAKPVFAILITSKDTMQTYQAMFKKYWANSR